MNKQVLVVIPTLGERLEMLVNCLESVFSQNYPVKVVVIFPEKKSKTMASLKINYPEVTLEPRNLNMIDSVNFVLQNYSYYKYFTWISDDDLLANDSLSRSIFELEKNSKIIGTFGAVEYIDLLGKKIGEWSPPSFAQKINNFVPSAIKLEGTVFRMAVIKKVGLIPNQIKYCPDVYLILKSSKHGKFYKIQGLSLAKFRIHNDSPTAKNRIRSNLEAHKIQFSLGSIYDKTLIIFFGPIIFLLKILIFKIVA